MDINTLLYGVQCACGKHHRCDIRYVAIGKNTIAGIGDLSKEYDNILLVADENTYAAAGKQTVAALNGK